MTIKDITVIELIMTAPKKTEFVDIFDAFLSYDVLEYLTHDHLFLHHD